MNKWLVGVLALSVVGNVVLGVMVVRKSGAGERISYSNYGRGVRFEYPVGWEVATVPAKVPETDETIWGGVETWEEIGINIKRHHECGGVVLGGDIVVSDFVLKDQKKTARQVVDDQRDFAAKNPLVQFKSLDRYTSPGKIVFEVERETTRNGEMKVLYVYNVTDKKGIRHTIMVGSREGKSADGKRNYGAEAKQIVDSLGYDAK